MRRSTTSEFGLVRAIGVRALAANGVNQIVGASIFVFPAVVAATLGRAAVIAYLICAAAGGLVMLCLAELGSVTSQSGGIYAYAEAVFGPYVGFLAGVLFWFGCQVTGSAFVATVLASTAADLFPALAGWAPRSILLISTYALLAAVNVRGVRLGVRVVELMTAAKLAPLLILIVAGLVASKPTNLAWPTTWPSIADVGRAALPLMLAFVGLEGALSVSGEILAPAKTVPRAIVLALAVTTALYVAVHLAAQGVLSPEGLARSQQAPLAAAADAALGGGGRLFVLLATIVSTLAYLSGEMLASPRLLYAFAHDGFLPPRFGRLHPAYRTPAASIVTHATIACIVAVTGTVRTLAVLSVVSTLVIYLVCCVATLVARQHARPASFRVPGGPAIPLLAILVVLWLLSNGTTTEFIAVASTLIVASILYTRRRIAPVAS